MGAERKRRLGTKIHNLRKARHLRFLDVTMLTGLSIAKLCRIEHGDDPVSYSDLCALALAFEVPLPSLLPKGVRVVSVPHLDFGGDLS